MSPSPALPIDDQAESRVRLRWGRRGARAASAAGDVLIVVDVLSFSTTTALAVERGAEVFPCRPGPEASQLAARVGGVCALRRGEPGITLSPASVRTLERGARFVLPSPNGSFCSAVGAEGCAAVFTGALVNASAAARAADRVARASEVGITVLACGERWPSGDADDGALRVALEDALGAGLILAQLEGRSPDAELCAMAAQAAGERIPSLVAACNSGLELVAKGFPADVEFATRVDSCAAAPRLLLGEGAPRYRDEARECADS